MSVKKNVGPNVSTVPSVRIATRAASKRTLRSKEIQQETPQTFAQLSAISRSERLHLDSGKLGPAVIELHQRGIVYSARDSSRGRDVLKLNAVTRSHLPVLSRFQIAQIQPNTHHHHERSPPRNILCAGALSALNRGVGSAARKAYAPCYGKRQMRLGYSINTSRFIKLLYSGSGSGHQGLGSHGICHLLICTPLRARPASELSRTLPRVMQGITSSSFLGLLLAKPSLMRWLPAEWSNALAPHNLFPY